LRLRVPREAGGQGQHRCGDVEPVGGEKLHHKFVFQYRIGPGFPQMQSATLKRWEKNRVRESGKDANSGS
jgi:hypothetical protein